jgi:hypothetical protein
LSGPSQPRIRSHRSKPPTQTPHGAVDPELGFRHRRRSMTADPSSSLRWGSIAPSPQPAYPSWSHPASPASEQGRHPRLHPSSTSLSSAPAGSRPHPPPVDLAGLTAAAPASLCSFPASLSSRPTLHSQTSVADELSAPPIDLVLRDLPHPPLATRSFQCLLVLSLILW